MLCWKKSFVLLIAICWLFVIPQVKANFICFEPIGEVFNIVKPLRTSYFANNFEIAPTDKLYGIRQLNFLLHGAIGLTGSVEVALYKDSNRAPGEVIATGTYALKTSGIVFSSTETVHTFEPPLPSGVYWLTFKFLAPQTCEIFYRAVDGSELYQTLEMSTDPVPIWKPSGLRLATQITYQCVVDPATVTNTPPANPKPVPTLSTAKHYFYPELSNAATLMVHVPNALNLLSASTMNLTVDYVVTNNLVQAAEWNFIISPASVTVTSGTINGSQPVTLVAKPRDGSTVKLTDDTEIALSVRITHIECTPSCSEYDISNSPIASVNLVLQGLATPQLRIPTEGSTHLFPLEANKIAINLVVPEPQNRLSIDTTMNLNLKASGPQGWDIHLTPSSFSIDSFSETITLVMVYATPTTQVDPALSFSGEVLISVETPVVCTPPSGCTAYDLSGISSALRLYAHPLIGVGIRDTVTQLVLTESISLYSVEDGMDASKRAQGASSLELVLSDSFLFTKQDIPVTVRYDPAYVDILHSNTLSPSGTGKYDVTFVHPLTSDISTIYSDRLYMVGQKPGTSVIQIDVNSTLATALVTPIAIRIFTLLSFLLEGYQPEVFLSSPWSLRIHPNAQYQAGTSITLNMNLECKILDKNETTNQAATKSENSIPPAQGQSGSLVLKCGEGTPELCDHITWSSDKWDAAQSVSIKPSGMSVSYVKPHSCTLSLVVDNVSSAAREFSSKVISKTMTVWPDPEAYITTDSTAVSSDNIRRTSFTFTIGIKYTGFVSEQTLGLVDSEEPFVLTQYIKENPKKTLVVVFPFAVDWKGYIEQVDSVVVTQDLQFASVTIGAIPLLPKVSKASVLGVYILPGALRDVNSITEALKLQLELRPDSTTDVAASAAASVASAASFVSISTGGMLTAALTLGKIRMLLSSVSCPNSDFRGFRQATMSWLEHPFGVVIGSSDISKEVGRFAGAALMNTLLVMVWFVLHFTVGVVVHVWKSRTRDAGMVDSEATKVLETQGSVSGEVFTGSGGIWHALAFVRFPSLGVFIMCLFFQIIITFSLKSALYTHLTGLRVLGAVVFIISLVVPIAWVAVVTYRTPSQALYNPISSPPYFGLIYRGTWVSTKDTPSFIPQHGHVIQSFNRNGYGCLLAELTLTALLGILDAIEPMTQKYCIVRQVLALILFLLQFIVLVYIWPYDGLFDAAYFTSMAFVQLLACTLITIGHITNPHYWGTQFAIYVLLVVAALYFLKFLLLAMILIWNCCRSEREGGDTNVDPSDVAKCTDLKPSSSLTQDASSLETPFMLEEGSPRHKETNEQGVEMKTSLQSAVSPKASILLKRMQTEKDLSLPAGNFSLMSPGSLKSKDPWMPLGDEDLPGDLGVSESIKLDDYDEKDISSWHGNILNNLKTQNIQQKISLSSASPRLTKRKAARSRAESKTYSSGSGHNFADNP